MTISDLATNLTAARDDTNRTDLGTKPVRLSHEDRAELTRLWRAATARRKTEMASGKETS